MAKVMPCLIFMPTHVGTCTCCSLWLSLQTLWVTNGSRKRFCLCIGNMALWELCMSTSRSFSLEWAPMGKDNRIPILLSFSLMSPSGKESEGLQVRSAALDHSELVQKPSLCYSPATSPWEVLPPPRTCKTGTTEGTPSCRFQKRSQTLAHSH